MLIYMYWLEYDENRESLRAAHMARTLLFPASVELLAEYVPVTQRYGNFQSNVDVFRHSGKN